MALVREISTKHDESIEHRNRTCDMKTGAMSKKAPSNPMSAVENKLQSMRLAMVNNAKRSDIVFVVGQSEPMKIHAHSPILIMSSEVFDSMFSGDFEIATEIPVTDVEPDIFLQLMNFIYAGLPAVTLTTGNMIDLLYGAQKYMLHSLKKTCEDFIVANTNNNNLLEVYNASQLFENFVIKDMCYNVLLDNPLRFFNDKMFNELSQRSIKELMNQTKINCSEDQLRRCVLQWLRNQLPDEELTDAAAYERLEAMTGVTEASFAKKQFFNIKLDSFGQFTTALLQKTRTVCHPNRSNDGGSQFLHGIGVYTGVELYEAQENVTISFMERDSASESWFHLKTLTEPVKQQRTLSVANIMFEKLQVKRHILVDIDFGSLKSRYCVKKTCELFHDHFKTGCEMFPYNDESFIVKVPYTAVAYLLCSDEPKNTKNSVTNLTKAFTFQISNAKDV